MDASLLVIPRPVYDVPTECGSILGRIKHVTGDSITEEILARLFGVKKVLVAGGIRNMAPEVFRHPSMTCPARPAPRDLPRHPMISWGDAARRLGVDKSHLWRVMNGRRGGCAGLRARYEALLRDIAAAARP